MSKHVDKYKQRTLKRSKLGPYTLTLPEPTLLGALTDALQTPEDRLYQSILEAYAYHNKRIKRSQKASKKANPSAGLLLSYEARRSANALLVFLQPIVKDILENSPNGADLTYSLRRYEPSTLEFIANQMRYIGQGDLGSTLGKHQPALEKAQQRKANLKEANKRRSKKEEERREKIVADCRLTKLKNPKLNTTAIDKLIAAQNKIKPDAVRKIRAKQRKRAQTKKK